MQQKCGDCRIDIKGKVVPVTGKKENAESQCDDFAVRFRESSAWAVNTALLFLIFLQIVSALENEAISSPRLSWLSMIAVQMQSKNIMNSNANAMALFALEYTPKWMQMH